MIKLEGIWHAYGEEWILRDITLRIEEKKFIAFTGASGNGKSTLARIIAGHLKPDKGRVIIKGKDRTRKPGRDVWLIRQNDLFPWLRVLDQVIFCQAKKNIEMARKIIAMMRLEGSERRFPGQLSEGMKQRLSLARALAVQPEVLILDEPFGSLNEEIKEPLHKDLLEIWQDKTTVIYISHQKEDLRFAKDTFFLENGIIVPT